MKRIIIFLSFIPAAIILVLFTCVFFTSQESSSYKSFADAFGPPTSANKMKRIFSRDQEELSTVANFLIDSGHTEVNISSSYLSNKMFVGMEIGDVEIEDEAATEAIHYLLEIQGYDYIKRKDNTIFFQEWSALRDNSRGIAYSINREDKPEIQFLTRLEPLDNKGWYYYEVDYNEWRIQNKESQTN